MAAAKRVNDGVLGATIDIGGVDVDGVELRRAVGPDPRDQGAPVALGRHHAFAWVGGGGRSGQGGLQAAGHAIAIDTGAGTFGDGRLTAVILPERRFITVTADDIYDDGVYDS